MFCVSKSMKFLSGMVVAALAGSAWAGSPVSAGAAPLATAAAIAMTEKDEAKQPGCMERAVTAGDCKLIAVDVTLVGEKGARSTAHLSAFTGNTTNYFSRATAREGKTGLTIQVTPGNPRENGAVPLRLVVDESWLEASSSGPSGVVYQPTVRQFHVDQRFFLKSGETMRLDGFDGGETRAIEVVARVVSD